MWKEHVVNEYGLVERHSGCTCHTPWLGADHWLDLSTAHTPGDPSGPAAAFLPPPVPPCSFPTACVQSIHIRQSIMPTVSSFLLLFSFFFSYSPFSLLSSVSSPSKQKPDKLTNCYIVRMFPSPTLRSSQ